MWHQGFTGLLWWQALLVSLAMTHVTIVAVTVYLHRHSAHRALELHPGLAHFFRLWLWLSTGMNTRSWTAIHRKHHAFCETAEDPHSPVVLGLGRVLREGAELYQQADTAEIRDKYGKGTPEDWIERNIYRHTGLGITLMFALDVLLFGLAGIAVWAIQMIWIPLNASLMIWKAKFDIFTTAPKIKMNPCGSMNTYANSLLSSLILRYILDLFVITRLAPK